MLLTRARALGPEAVHVIDKNLALLRAVGIEAVGRREFPLPSTAAAAARVEARLCRQAALPDDFVVLNPGGGWASKLWPPGELRRAWPSACATAGLACLVTWGPGRSRSRTAWWRRRTARPRRCFPTTLLELVELARRARLVVAADTGPIHLACAVRTPVVGIFGPTDPARNGPWSPRRT